MRNSTRRRYVPAIENLAALTLASVTISSFVMPPAYVDPEPPTVPPTPLPPPPVPQDPSLPPLVPDNPPLEPHLPAYAEPAPVQVAFNPDITRLPAPIQADPNPVLTMFQVASGQATIIDPTKLTPQPAPPLAAPRPTLPPLPPPLPTSLPTLP